MDDVLVDTFHFERVGTQGPVVVLGLVEVDDLGPFDPFYFHLKPVPPRSVAASSARRVVLLPSG